MALAELPHLQRWSEEGESPIVQALFLREELVGEVLPGGRVVPARAA